MTPQPIGGKTPGAPRPAGWLGWIMPIGFGVLAVVLFAGSRQASIPLAPVHMVDRASLVVGPRRVAMSDPAHILVDGVAQNCNGCHQIFTSASPSGAVLSYHEDIRLSHGMNNRCVNCHDPTNRERLTLRDGATVAFAETPQLCAQCHGTVFRDWQRGTHGKTLGSWMTHSDMQRRLSCNECHDPHSPKYEPYEPMPGPNTLRMGNPNRAIHHAGAESESPLQKWLTVPDPHTPSTPAHTGGHP